MANLEELVVTLTAETSGLKAELEAAAKTTRQQLAKMQGSLDELSQNSSKNIGFLQSAFASMAGFLAAGAIQKGLELLKEGFAEVGHLLVEGADDAQKEETALQNLANSLAITGKYTEDTMKSLTEFTGRMEELTGVQDDVVASNLALLSTMTKLSGEGLMNAEKAALALSASYNIDLDSAVRLVGKGIEGNTEALKRYGLEIQGTTDKNENLSRIMHALPFEAALAKTNTLAGATKLAANEFHNFFEAVSTAVVKNPVVIAVIGEMAKIFHELTDSANANAVALREGFAKALITTINVLGIATEGVDILVRSLKVLVNLVELAATPFYTLQKSIQQALGGEAITPIKNFADSVKTDLSDIGDAVNNETVFASLSQRLAEIGNAGENSFGKIADSAGKAIAPVNGVTAAAKELTEAQKQHNEIVKEFATGLADSQRQIGSYYTFQGEVLKTALDNETITKDQYFQAQTELQANQFAAENAALEEAHAAKMLSEQQFLDAKQALIQKQALAELQIMSQKTQFEKDQQKIRAANLKDSFATIATLSQSGNATLAAIGKAAAITTATIDGFAAVQKALASAPPPFNFALAALVGTATAANVAKIAGVPLKTGITEVPRSAGGGNTGDNFPAILNPGERVVDSQTNQDLKAFLAGQSGGQNVTINVSVAPGTGMTRDQVDFLIDQLNNHFANGGQKLIPGAV